MADKIIVNGQVGGNVKPITKEFQQELFNLFSSLIGKHFDHETGCFNYRTVVKSDEYKNYTEKAKELGTYQVFNLSENERKAFFINIYNALTVHSVATLYANKGPGEKVQDLCQLVPLFWDTYAYNIGGHVFTLDDIEHGVLRANKVHMCTKKTAFTGSDERFPLSLPSVDPRVHFTLNCATISSPPLRVYLADNLDQQLNDATSEYLNENTSVEKQAKYKLTLSQTIEWFADDFGNTTAAILSWMIPYLEGEKKEMLTEIAGLKDLENSVKISYAYNWASNHKE